MSSDDDYTPRAADGSSRDAGEHLARSGKTAELKRDIRITLAGRTTSGMTVKEYVRLSGRHHGQVSGAFSTLHERGDLARLKERRDRYEVYVLPEHVDGRDTREHRAVAKRRAREELVAQIEATEDVLDGWPQMVLTPWGRAVDEEVQTLITTINEYIGRAE